MATLQLPASTIAALQKLAVDFDGSTLQVGFMAGATYPDGTSVPDVAAQNEFGNSKRPARPFFRNMIAKESPTWASKIAALAGNGLDAQKILGLMGEDLKGGLQQSINDLQSPPLSPVTIAKKGFSKPLIETSHMLNSVTYRLVTKT